MSVVVVKVNAVDLSATVTPDWQLIQSADRGTTAASGFNLDDGASAITVPALKPTTVEIPAAANPRLFTGYTIDRNVGRNEEAIMGPPATDRRWAVNVTDLNALLNDVILRGNNAVRPAETDISRINWLLGGYLAESGVFDNGFIDSSSPVAMDATDYRGQYCYDVLTTCAESSGLNWFVDWDPVALEPTLNYRPDGGTVSRASTILISNHAADIDNVNTFAPSMDAALSLDPRNVYSGVLYNFAGGAYIYVTRPATVSAYRTREISVSSGQVGKIATATALANAYLNRIATELTQISLRLKLARADVTRIQAGMRIQVKLTEVPGFSAFQWININKLTTTPVDGTQAFFWCDLVLLNIQPTGFHGGTTPPGTSNPPVPPAPTGSCGITDSFNRPTTTAGVQPGPFGWGSADMGTIWADLIGDPSVGFINNNRGEIEDGTGARVGNQLEETVLPFPLGEQITIISISTNYTAFGVFANSDAYSIEVRFDQTVGTTLTITDGTNTVVASGPAGVVPAVPFTASLTVDATGAHLDVIDLDALVANATPSPLAAIIDVEDPYVAHKGTGDGSISTFENLDIDGVNRCTAGGSPITGTNRNGVVGTGDGANTVFIVPGGYLPGSVAVWVSGDLQVVNENDPPTGTIYVTPAPALGKQVNATWIS